MHHLKKALTSDKLAHQETLAQLETSYSLNRELQEVIKTQTVAVNSLQKQMIEKSNRMNEMTETYEMHLRELK